VPTKPLERLMFAQGDRCFFCEEPLPKADASVEHLLASANGGGNADENCVACCKAVNALFGSMSLKEKFRVVLNQKGKFRCPNRVAAVPAIAETQPSQETYAKVCENLKARGTSRPRVLKTLTSTIAAQLKGHPAAEVAATLKRLKADGIVEISEAEKVVYKF
jgi:hypothetical protein